MVTTKELTNIKKALVDYISTRELDDGDELCLESQEMILKWIEVYFDDVVSEMENTAPRDTTLVGIPPKELASLRAEVEKLKAENEKLRTIDAVNMDTLTGLNNECARLRTENAALRELAPEAWEEGLLNDYDYDTFLGSATKQRLDEIAKEG